MPLKEKDLNALYLVQEHSLEVCHKGIHMGMLLYLKIFGDYRHDDWGFLCKVLALYEEK